MIVHFYIFISASLKPEKTNIWSKNIKEVLNNRVSALLYNCASGLWDVSGIWYTLPHVSYGIETKQTWIEWSAKWSFVAFFKPRNFAPLIDFYEVRNRARLIHGCKLLITVVNCAHEIELLVVISDWNPSIQREFVQKKRQVCDRTRKLEVFNKTPVPCKLHFEESTTQVLSVWLSSVYCLLFFFFFFLFLLDSSD